jgi:hypothetical protein
VIGGYSRALHVGARVDRTSARALRADGHTGPSLRNEGGDAYDDPGLCAKPAPGATYVDDCSRGSRRYGRDPF